MADAAPIRALFLDGAAILLTAASSVLFSKSILALFAYMGESAPERSRNVC
jgi:hypothetical protein